MKRDGVAMLAGAALAAALAGCSGDATRDDGTYDYFQDRPVQELLAKYLDDERDGELKSFRISDMDDRPIVVEGKPGGEPAGEANPDTSGAPGLPAAPDGRGEAAAPPASGAQGAGAPAERGAVPAAGGPPAGPAAGGAAAPPRPTPSIRNEMRSDPVGTIQMDASKRKPGVIPIPEGLQPIQERWLIITELKKEDIDAAFNNKDSESLNRWYQAHNDKDHEGVRRYIKRQLDRLAQ